VLVDVDVDDEESDVDDVVDALDVDESDVELEVEVDDESDVEPGAVEEEVLPRLSFLKKPVPLKVTPTGWNTFLTASTLPESGCAYSVSESSVNDCCTSIVSPVSTNL
jgi:hypothetical protein